MSQPNACLVVVAVLAAATLVTPVQASPEIQVVEQSIVIDAPIEAIWHAISTEEGLSGWVAPEARVELEIGGDYELYFWPENAVGDRGIEGTKVLSFVPNRLLSYWGSSPPQFTEVHLKNVAWATYTLRELPTGAVEVRQYGCWPKFGEPWEEEFRAWVESALRVGLEKLAQHVAQGSPEAEALGTTRPGVKEGSGTMSEVGRLLHKEVRVDAPIEDVWRAWTTEDGLEFISQKSNVQMEIGGPYEWFLDLEPDEHGKRGGEGAVIHAFLPPEMLAFSWTFPPSIPSLRSSGATTQVVVRLREVDGGTQVDFRHFGWQEGEDWDLGYEYFDNAWDLVLARLKTHLEGSSAES